MKCPETGKPCRNTHPLQCRDHGCGAAATKANREASGPEVSAAVSHGQECVVIANRASGYQEVLRRVLEGNGLSPDTVDNILALARDRKIDAAILAAKKDG